MSITNEDEYLKTVMGVDGLVALQSEEMWGADLLPMFDAIAFGDARRASIKFIIPIHALPKGRGRSTVMKTPSGKLITRTYTPQNTRTFEATALMLFYLILEDLKISTPVCVGYQFFLPRPKGLMRKKDPKGPMAHTRRPDLDNLEKSLSDAMRRHLDDDALIHCSITQKAYTPIGAAPRVEVTVAWEQPDE